MDNQLFAAFLIHNKSGFSRAWFGASVSQALKDARNDRIITGPLATSFMRFFRDECEPFLDSIADAGESKSVIEAFQGKWIVEHVLGDILLKSNAREMQKMLRDLYKRFESDKPLVVVRSPRELSQKTKQHIRNFYDSGVVFERDANLVGGLMIYRDGIIIDKSFSSILSRIPSLSS